jgi:hypothetical protein
MRGKMRAKRPDDIVGRVEEQDAGLACASVDAAIAPLKGGDLILVGNFSWQQHGGQ